LPTKDLIAENNNNKKCRAFVPTRSCDLYLVKKKVVESCKSGRQYFIICYVGKSWKNL